MWLVMEDVVEVVKEAVEAYNRYRTPEARARVVKVSGNDVTIEFTGPFCSSCGLYDWVEDLKYVLEERGVGADIVEVRDDLSSNSVTAVFRVRSTK